jgi:signal transduction histidine kinase
MYTRLLLSFTFIIAIGIAMTVWLAYNSATAQLEHYMIDGQMVRPGALQRALGEHYLAHDGWDELPGMLPALIAAASDGPMQGVMGSMMGMAENHLRIMDANGAVVAEFLGSHAAHLPPAGGPQLWPLMADDSAIGQIEVTGSLMANTAEQAALVAAITRSVLTAGLIAGLVGLGLAALLVRQITRPLEQVASAAGQIAQGNLAVRVNAAGQDETAALARSFNQMAGDLERQERSRQRLMHDIAHELRTPLAGMQGLIEGLQDGILPADQETLGALHTDVLLLGRLIQDLRTLAEADAGHAALHLAPLDPVELCRGQVNALQGAATERQVTLRYTGATQLPPITGDRLRLGQVLRNLLDNALRHTPPGGRIDVGAGVTAGHVIITVSDDGEGIPADALPHLFERFYRVDSSRSRESGGSGLGLAIARQWVEAHGGTIAVASPARGGTVVEVRVPKG